jgi:hypothetical protein
MTHCVSFRFGRASFSTAKPQGQAAPSFPRKNRSTKDAMNVLVLTTDPSLVSTVRDVLRVWHRNATH